MPFKKLLGRWVGNLRSHSPHPKLVVLLNSHPISQTLKCWFPEACPPVIHGEPSLVHHLAASYRFYKQFNVRIDV